MKSSIQLPGRRRHWAAVLLAGAVCVGGEAMAQDTRQAASVKTPAAKSAVDVPTVKYTRFVLPNGLVVIASEDHSSPLVSMDLTYRVGSKDERPGKRGVAHFFEHMMFEGSANVEPGEHQRIIQQAGGSAQAYTNEDRTWYWGTVPTHMLETTLWLEAERMAFLPARLDSVRFERARESVMLEYNQQFLAAPASQNPGGVATLAAMFPEGHPYRVPAIGDIDEVKKMTVADLREFFARYYVPNNVTLTVVGDFQTADLRAMTTKYFGGIPRGAAIKRTVVPTVVLAKEKRIVLEDRNANAQLLWVTWVGVSGSHPDRVALTALSGILSAMPNSRLQRALINERRLATSFSRANGHFDLTDAGILQVVAGATAGRPMTELELAMDSVIAAVRNEGVTPAELKRWRAAYVVGKLKRLQTTDSVARLLAEGELYQGDPGVQLKDIDAANRLTVADIQRVARKYLGPGRVVLSIVPAGKLELRSKPDAPYENVTKTK